MTSRRAFLQRGATAALVVGLPEPTAIASTAHRSARRTFLDPTRPPDVVGVQTSEGTRRLQPSGPGRWEGTGVTVETVPTEGALRVRLTAPEVPVHRISLRWRGDLDDTRLMLGDAWERGYGDLEWRGFVPERVMPWYFAAWDGEATHAYGVRTGARAFCFWYADPGGVSLWADVRAGGEGVLLGDRTLDACDVVGRAGRAGESPFGALRAFCRAMCPAPVLPEQPVYGSNDWYWTYAKNSADTVLVDAGHVVELSPTGTNRPFCVIDDGWQPQRGSAGTGVGLWDRGNERFPDMAALAASVRAAGARPGIWIRPLLAPEEAPAAWRLPRERRFLDPTVPEVLEKVAQDIGRLPAWGFRLVKHDYSTFDLLGRWGFQMGSSPTADGWTFQGGPTRTTAEVIDGLYATIQRAAGDAVVIGCNTVSHLSAGRFAVCRIGDDTSGRSWARTRKMGVNTLAFRGVQHDAFYAADPDCVGVTNDIPWELNRQWLDLVSRSGTPLFVSLAPDALDAARRRDLRVALARAEEPQPLGEPLDWRHTTWPGRWRLMDAELGYDWVAEGDVALRDA